MMSNSLLAYLLNSCLFAISNDLASSITLKIILGTALLGGTAGVIGTYAVLRRRALVGDMLAHAALPGICIAFLLTSSRNLLWLSLGALASGMLGLLSISIIRRWTRTKDDAAIGIILSTFFGAGVVLLSYVQRHHSGNQAGLDTYMFGEIAGMQLRDIQLLALVAIGLLLTVTLLHKEFKLLSFDPDFTAAQGWPTFLLDMTMMGLLAIVTIVGLPICGVILMAALIITPSAAARYWTNHLGSLLILAGIFGALAGSAGALLASPLPGRWLGWESDWASSAKVMPPGPLIVLTATALLIASLLFAPQYGIIARSIAELRLRARILREHLLRSLFELSESHLPQRPKVKLSKLVDYRSWSRPLVNWQLRLAQRQGLVEQHGESVQLTENGLEEAAELTRAHRLWELFLVEHANIAADHVDRDADDVEHLLPEQLLKELEQQIAEPGQLPTTELVPESPHQIEREDHTS